MPWRRIRRIRKSRAAAPPLIEDQLLEDRVVERRDGVPVALVGILILLLLLVLGVVSRYRQADPVPATVSEGGALTTPAALPPGVPVTVPTTALPVAPYAPRLQVRIDHSRLVPLTTPQGLSAYKLLIDWENTGALPVSLVKATLVFYDEAGRELQRVNDYTIFMTDNPNRSVRPGEIYRMPEDAGFVYTPLPPDLLPAARAGVAVTKVE